MNTFFTALKNKRARKEFIKSIIVGVVAVVLDFVVQAFVLYLAATEYYANVATVFFGSAYNGYVEPISIYLTSVIISFIVSVSVNYTLSAFFVYEYGNAGRNKNGVIKFFIFSTIGLLLTMLISFVFRSVLMLPVFPVKVIASTIVFIYNFFTRKHYIFNIALIRDDNNTINL